MGGVLRLAMGAFLSAKGHTCQPTVAPYPPLMARSESPFSRSYDPAVVPRGGGGGGRVQLWVFQPKLLWAQKVQK